MLKRHLISDDDQTQEGINWLWPRRFVRIAIQKHSSDWSDWRGKVKLLQFRQLNFSWKNYQQGLYRKLWTQSHYGGKIMFLFLDEIFRQNVLYTLNAMYLHASIAIMVFYILCVDQSPTHRLFLFCLVSKAWYWERPFLNLKSLHTIEEIKYLSNRNIVITS